MNKKNILILIASLLTMNFNVLGSSLQIDVELSPAGSFSIKAGKISGKIKRVALAIKKLIMLSLDHSRSV